MICFLEFVLENMGRNHQILKRKVRVQKDRFDLLVEASRDLRLCLGLTGLGQMAQIPVHIVPCVWE